MLQTLRGRLALAALMLAPLAAPVVAQGPTPEGTVITNTATASWTDANGNTYTPVTATATVTVGFTAGMDVTSAASVTPASPSTGNGIAFTIQNIGNGVDTITASFTIGGGVTVTGYKLGASTYASVALLNAALDALQIAQNGSVTVTVVYNVAPGQGGQTIPVTMTATSQRTTSTSDAATTNVQPPVASSVAVSPDAATASKLPSNGTTYTQTFVVANGGNATDNFSLSASVPGAVLTIVSVNGVAGSSSSVSVGSGTSASVVVVYTVGDVAAGSSEQLTLVATSGNDASKSDAGDLTVSVIRAAISMTKTAYRDNQTSAIGAGLVLPGEYIQYKLTITNNGGAAASNVSISDPLPAEVVYDSAAGDAAGWTINQAAGTVTASLVTLNAGESRTVWVRVKVQ